MNEPLWLKANGTLQLLNYIVDKLDAADSQGKSLVRAIKLDGKSFPALYKSGLEEEREQLWGFLQQMVLWGWFYVKLDRPQSGQALYECNPRLSILNESEVRRVTGRPVRIRSSAELWREAVFVHLNSDESIKETVSRLKVEIPGRSAEEIVHQLALLPSIANEPLLLREVSARLFWGQSKVLDGRQQLVATVLQQDECPFPEMPVQLQVHLPQDGFSGVLFIENQATFEQATRDSTKRYHDLALVYSSGFKGSAKRLRSPSGSSVYFAAHGAIEEKQTAKFIGWLRAEVKLHSWFWGDLDYAGMRILAALRDVFDGLAAWQPGYEPMLDRLRKKEGHAPDEAGKAGQGVIEETGCHYADTQLLPSLKVCGTFVDQEVV
ncbi:hypothetical protein GALL_81860 [mine drainage metagenome]|uniref:Wadjet protein JetD C-terminal domain-containing protein n=1 Tax=mine drainage metagenome TaxID=410659 RepID=A0A1J5T7I9_9ZZZZ